MTFYINEIKEAMPGRTCWDQRCIGLFDGNGRRKKYYSNDYWDGEAYHDEGDVYYNVTLLAYGIQNVKYNTVLDYKLPFDGGFYENVNRYFDRISIFSAYCEKKIVASSAAEAIQIFKAQTWYDPDEEYTNQRRREAESEAASVVPPDIQNIMRKARYEKGRGIYLKTITIENISTEEYERLKDWCSELTGKILISVYERPTKDSPKATVTIHNPAMEYLKYFMGDRKT